MDAFNHRNYFNYTDSPYPIPPLKIDAYQDAWQYLASPGNWWTGSERVNIALATRDAYECDLCRVRKAALSPLGLEGEHTNSFAQTATTVPIDVVHRLTTDPARLTQNWIESLLSDDFGYGHYVETVSVVVTLICIDSFHQALGLPLEPLPVPLPGEPDHYYPPGAEIDVAWVPMLYPENLTAREADIFFEAPVTANVIRAMSLVPEAVRKLNSLSRAQYVHMPDVRNMATQGELSLTRPQTELIAARTSAINDCFY
jgi:hypothetical protein